MSIPIQYCKSWFRAKKCPTELWDEERARKAHMDGTLYCALMGPADAPSHFLELNCDFVGVGFLDRHLREYLYYAFVGAETDRLFLQNATFREFDGATDRVTEGTTYLFQTTGKLTISRQSFSPQAREVATSVTDLSGNYEMRPKFGQYDALLVSERIAIAAP
jgi:hypothetical protein